MTDEPTTITINVVWNSRSKKWLITFAYKAIGRQVSATGWVRADSTASLAIPECWLLIKGLQQQIESILPLEGA